MPGSIDELVRPFLARPERAGILTDFDGTLAPIVEDPDAARPLDGAVALLHELAARYRRVAVVSGRPAARLARWLHLDGSARLVASGLYGMEYAEGGEVTVHPAAQEWRAVVDDVARLAEEQAPANVIVERKGLTVTLHYRVCPEHGGWVRSWAAAQAERTGLVVHPARMSEELRPAVPLDKGSVVEQLALDLDAVCFLGDDVGDLPAFRALDRLAARGVHTLKVVAASVEAPPELLAAGHVCVEGPVGALDVLRRLRG